MTASTAILARAGFPRAIPATGSLGRREGAKGWLSWLRAALDGGVDDTSISGAQEHRSLKRQALIAFSIRVASAGLAYLSQVFFARMLGVAGYGFFSVAWAFVLVLGHVAPLGFNESAVRFLPRYHLRGLDALARGFITTGGEVALIGGALFAILGATGLLVFPVGDACWPVLGALACLMPFAYQDWLEGVARGLDRPGLALACPYLLRPVLMTAVLAAAAFIWRANPATAMLAAFLATLATASLQSLLVHRAARAALGDGATRGSTRLWLPSSLPLAGGTACDQGSAYADVIALGLLRTPAEAAIYIAASRTLALAGFAQYAISVVAGRRFAAAQADGGPSALLALATATTRLTLLASCLAVGIVLIAGIPLLSLFGQGFTSAYPALSILCVSALVRAVAGQREAILTVLGRQKGLFAISTATLGVAVLANLALTGPFGVMGAACAATLAATFRTVSVIYLARAAMASPKRGSQ